MSEQKNYRQMLQQIYTSAGAVRKMIEEVESLRKQNEILTTVDAVAAQEASELRAKLQAAEQLIAAAKEFDESDDDAAWEPPHPIFALAEENDKLRAKLRQYEEAEKQEPVGYICAGAFHKTLSLSEQFKEWLESRGKCSVIHAVYTRPAPMKPDGSDRKIMSMKTSMRQTRKENPPSGVE